MCPHQCEDGVVDVSDVIKTRRTELRMSQAELAAQAGIDVRQIRRYEAGETQPTLSVAGSIARVLGISLDELAGETTKRINLAGDWFAGWQTSRNGIEAIAVQEVRLEQQRDLIDIRTLTRGLSVDDGGYHWHGELRLWDNQVLMGWYTSNDDSIRSKGTMYFVVHPHGINMTGRWVGLGFDDAIMTGWSSMAKTEDDVRKLIESLREQSDARE